VGTPPPLFFGGIVYIYLSMSRNKEKKDHQRVTGNEENNGFFFPLSILVSRVWDFDRIGEQEPGTKGPGTKKKKGGGKGG
jgi:hypothetical protein